MKRRALGAALLVLALSAAALGVWIKSSALQNAPNVVFTTLTGETFSMSDLRGHPALVTFWATDCPSCIEEIPHLIQLHQDFSGQGLKVIAVAMHYDMPSRVIAVTRAERLPYDVVVDPTGRLSAAFGDVQWTPSTFLVTQNGIITLHHTGLMDTTHVRAKIMQLLESGNS